MLATLKPIGKWNQPEDHARHVHRCLGKSVEAAEVASAFGFHVEELPFRKDPDAIHGTSYAGELATGIYIRVGMTREERNWAIAHEIGHLLLGHDFSAIALAMGKDARDGYAAACREADTFASELLREQQMAMALS